MSNDAGQEGQLGGHGDERADRARAVGAAIAGSGDRADPGHRSPHHRSPGFRHSHQRGPGVRHSHQRRSRHRAVRGRRCASVIAAAAPALGAGAGRGPGWLLDTGVRASRHASALPLRRSVHPYGSPSPYSPTQAQDPRDLGHLAAVVVAAVIAISGVVGAAVEHAMDNTPAQATPRRGTFPPRGCLRDRDRALDRGRGNGSGNTPAGLNTTAIASEVDPALVDIDTTVAQGGAAAGTGMVLTSSGLVLTNNHVIENATTINVQVVGAERTYSATVLGYSVTDDVALLQLQNASGLKTISTGNSSNLSVGQPVVAIGNAGGTGGTPSAVGGTVTALDQTITAGDAGTLSETLNGLIETDANIQPGDSGGALVNTAGKVIGMNIGRGTDR